MSWLRLMSASHGGRWERLLLVRASDDGLARGQRNGGVTRVISNATEPGHVSSINGMTCGTGGWRGSTWFMGGSGSRSCDTGL
jgi:hypothetical protein